LTVGSNALILRRVDTSPYEPPPLRIPGPAPQPSIGARLKKLLVPLGVVAVLLSKFKGLLFVLLKFLPILLKTGGTMLLSIWVYATYYGWQFALGFVLLLLVHECGHLLAAKRVGLKVGVPVFIPFLGALIALKEAPRNAWIEAQVGIGGPLLGALGSALCFGVYLVTGNGLFAALAFSGFFLNLFNLAPVGMLDGGRVVTALSPWLWLIGIAVIGYLLFARFNFVLLLIFLTSLPRVYSLFRKKSAEELRYFEVTPGQRWFMGALYFGLLIFLVFGMELSHLPVDRG
jgi:Zn-dependent protease